MAMTRGEKGWFGGVSALAVVLLLLLLSSCGDDCEDVAVAPGATVTVTATPGRPGSQVGKSVDSASERARQSGLSVAVHDASNQDEAPGGDWTVCFEKATLSKVDFAAVPDGAPCPKKDGRRIPWPKMPNVKGITYAKAHAEVSGSEHSHTLYCKVYCEAEVVKRLKCVGDRSR